MSTASMSRLQATKRTRSTSLTITERLPELRRDQWRIVTHPAQTKVIAMGRRWGKTYMAGSYALACADDGAAVAWVVPTYRNARPVWRFAEAVTGPVVKRLRVNRTERDIEFPSGGRLGIYTADNDVALRGESFDVVVVDEAAQIREETYTDVLLPTLADRDGRILLISTPKGLNWFYTEYQRCAQVGAAWNAPSSANPNANIKRAAMLARDRVPERTYKQEWLAEFVTDGSFFTNIDACATVEKPDAPGDHAGHTFVAGLDWGLNNDYTVLTIICRECSRVVDWLRTSGGDYITQRARVVALCNRWGVQTVLPERNSIGQPNIEMLRADGLTVMIGPDGGYGWFMSATNKPQLIESLAVALQGAAIRFPRVYANELRPFEVKTRATGYPEYSAPAGQHDDCVISLALAYRAATFGAQIW